MDYTSNDYLKNMFNLNNKNIIVIGSGSGIGRSASLAIAAHGGNLICADIQNIETENSTMVSIPRVKLSPAHFECTLFKIIDLPSDSKGNPNHLIIGNIIGINISDKIIKNDRIDIGELKPISRMGYDEYALINTIFSMKRPK